mmetsp:Transcript_7028/g.10517  ORF Transcript_7028/g.10517 Transcript_7028/m.10517 type:complete len:120 (+) Transcript_7028:140-499(+)
MKRNFEEGDLCASLLLGNGLFDRKKLYRDMNVHPSMISRMKKELVLDGHTGCVNRISWNDSGTLLASGSDDLHIGVWEYPSGKKRSFFRTQHNKNIFGVRFLDDSTIVSANQTKSLKED